jgi:hypothetical protein
MRITHPYILIAAAGMAWAVAVFGGVARVWTYEATAGTAARPPITRPDVGGVADHGGLPELVVLVHPRCPCSRATIAELARVMTECRGKLAATVLVLRPAGVPEGWERTGLWSSAAAIPGVTVRTDIGGEASRRFGAATSGQALLYAADGRLLFAGGITESRGHEGDNAGRSSVAALVLGGGTPGNAAPPMTPVYGCPLFDGAPIASPEVPEGSTSCPIK